MDGAGSVRVRSSAEVTSNAGSVRMRSKLENRPGTLKPRTTIYKSRFLSDDDEFTEGLFVHIPIA